MISKDKNNNKKLYITLDSGIDFRKIARIMTAAGWKINHATARNQLMFAMKKLLTHVGKQMGIEFTEERISELLNSRAVHSALCDCLFRAVNK